MDNEIVMFLSAILVGIVFLVGAIREIRVGFTIEWKQLPLLPVTWRRSDKPGVYWFGIVFHLWMGASLLVFGLVNLLEYLTKP